MSYGRYPYGGVGYAGSDVAEIPQADTRTTLAVEVAFTTDALDPNPVWVDITGDVRSWDVQRGRNRELERMQPGRATVVFGNRERQYDSVNAAGPWFGNIKPNRRVRIRETFNGVTYPVFDGFIDRWMLDYPGTGKDATATIVATDAFKLFARTELGRSVYAREVEADAPALWWHLDENIEKFEEGFALNSGALGTARDGTFVDVPNIGQNAIVVNDPGTSMRTVTVTDLGAPTPKIPPKMGVTLANSALDILGNSTFTVEAWQRLEFGGVSDATVWWIGISASDDTHALCSYHDSAGDLSNGRYRFIVVASGGLQYGVETPAASVLQGATHHVACAVESSGQMAIYIDGVRHTTQIGGTTGTNLSGVTRKTGGAFNVAHNAAAAAVGNLNWHGQTQEVAAYTVDLGSTRISAHYTAGTTPWVADQPSGRIRRVLQIAEWPGSPLYLNEALDTGNTQLQAAELVTTALEHLQKVSESEYVSLLFMGREGKVTFRDRATVFARDPGAIVYGDLVGEVGYTDFTPDDGDEVIRNKATVSRLNGVAKTATDAVSVDEFGVNEYVQEGLLHRQDVESQNHANFVVSEYAEPRRRITSLSVGPPISGQEGTVYPAMLGPELGDAITVRSRPLGGGALFEQVCAVEGIRAAGQPGGVRSTTFTLSPEFAFRALEDEDVATLGYAQVTANQAGISTLTDLTNLSVPVTVGTNRFVQITAQILTQRTVADGETNLYIREGSTTLQIMALRQNNVGVNETLEGSIVLDSPSPGSHTYKLSLERGGGTGTVQLTAAATFPAFILVEDIGPS